MKFVILTTMVADREAQQQHWRAHLEYLKSLQEQRVLLSAGSFEDRSGGLLLVEAPGLEEAIAWARQDPLVREGVQSYVVHGWLPSLPSLSEPSGRPPLKVDSSRVGPLKAPPPEESFRIVEAAAEGDHADLLISCFRPNAISKSDPVRGDYLRRAGGRGLRKLLLLLDDGVAGQLEFAPPDTAGLPIDGPGLCVIHCLWMLDAYSRLGGGRMLLAACGEASGAEGLATIAYNNSLPWMPRSYFEKHGFTAIDQLETGRFFGNTPIVAYLLWRPLKPGARQPTWDRGRLLRGVEFCPRYPWMFGKRLYWGEAFDHHGVLVKEGLRRPGLLQQLPVLSTKRVDNWTVVKFGIPSADLNRALELIQAALLDEPTYYAYIYGVGQMAIVFPDRIFRVDPDPQSWEPAIRYGVDKGVPREELVFEPCRFEDETF